MKTFYLIDGHAQLFRAYYAPFRPLTSPAGEPVKAVHVFTQMVLGILQKERPDYLAVAFDVSDSSTLRKGWFPAYKEHREAAPDDLHTQFARVVQVLEALRIPIFRKEGFEADDLIATIARRLAGADGGVGPVELRIASKDKDLHQILTDRVKLWDPSSGELIDPDTLRATKGYGPEHAVEIQTLTGDSTDNIPGAKGVGVKTAAKLVQQYGSADAVYEHLDELTPKLRENLLAHADTMPLTRRLVTLDPEVDFDFELESCAAPSPTQADVRALFDELGFRTLLEQLPATADGAGTKDPAGAAPAVGGATPAASPEAAAAVAEAVAVIAPDELTYRSVTTAAAFEAFLAELREQEAFAVDTETTGLTPVDADVVGYVFSWRAGEGVYVPVRANDGPHLDPDEVAAALRPILEDDATLKVGQNLKYDLTVLERAGIRLGGPLFDTMIAAALLHPERRAFGMDDLARDLLGHTCIPITDLIGKGKSQKSMLEVPLEEITRYAAEDGDITWRLYERLRAELDAADATLQRLFHEVEMPLVRVLARMERAGVALDAPQLEAYGRRLAQRIDELRRACCDSAGKDFNLDSPKQLGEVLFDDLKFRVVKRTKTSRSTDAGVLETLAAETDHPLPGLLLEYRELTKLLGTYLTPLPSLLSPTTGRLHASFHQTGAATGRLSSSDPNIQNIPVRTEAGREIRRAFVPGGDGMVLLTADYSQVELRMLAHFSEDEALLEAFREGLDIHAFVAAQIYGVPLEQVDAQQRRVAKTVNFGIVYGQTAFGLARTLRIPTGDAAAFIEAYKARYTGLDRFLQWCIAFAEEHGYVQTILGRRRPIPEIHQRNRNIRALGERLAINTVIQGSAADLIKLAMIHLDARLEREHPHARLLIQVHDELVVETPEDEAEAVRDAAVEEMTSALPLKVPLKVDAALGASWLDGKA